MADPRLIKKRVSSVKNIGKITKALEMVSASKIQKAQNAAINAKPYARVIYELVSSLAKDKIVEIPLMRIPEEPRTDLYIIVSTNRGLAGSLNTNLFNFLATYLLQRKTFKHFFVTIGKKGRSFAVSNGELTADFSDQKDIAGLVSAVVKLITDGFVSGSYDAVYIVYSEFINALRQEPKVKHILPISKLELEEEIKKEHFGILGEPVEKLASENTRANYSFEPDPVTVLVSLLPFYIEIQIAESIYESEASEHSARMVAMKNATDNASELFDSLSLEYNKARQALITTEISDITTAQTTIKD